MTTSGSDEPEADPLELARQRVAGALLAMQKPLARVAGRSGLGPVIIDLIGAIESLASEVERLRGDQQNVDAGLRRLEVVSAGDEQLLDDLAYALEAVQRDVDHLRGNVDRLMIDGP
jgi:hypothetical protein